MWKKNALCVACGNYKRQPWLRCKKCGREPASDYELARALVLSVHTGVTATIVGRSEADLKRIGTEIRSGRPYLFDPAEEHKALNAVQELREFQRRKIRRNQAIRVGVVLFIFLIAYILWRSTS